MDEALNKDRRSRTGHDAHHELCPCMFIFMEKKEKVRIILREIIRRIAKKTALQEAGYEEEIYRLALTRHPAPDRKRLLRFSDRPPGGYYEIFETASRNLEQSIGNTKHKIEEFRKDIERDKLWLDNYTEDKH